MPHYPFFIKSSLSKARENFLKYNVSTLILGRNEMFNCYDSGVKPSRRLAAGS